MKNKQRLHVGQRVWIPNRSVIFSVQSGVVMKLDEEILEPLCAGWWAEVMLDKQYTGILDTNPMLIRVSDCYTNEGQALREAIKHHNTELGFLMYKLEQYEQANADIPIQEQGNIPTFIASPLGITVW